MNLKALCVRAVKSATRQAWGLRLIVEPGDGTRYDLNVHSLGPDGTLITLWAGQRHSAAMICREEPHPDYISEKLRTRFEAAELIAPAIWAAIKAVHEEDGPE